MDAKSPKTLTLVLVLAGSFAPGLAGAESWFRDSTADANLRFEHFNGMTGERLFAEMMGAGGALADFDGDGDLDLYLVQGGRFGQAPDPDYCDTLFINKLVEGGKLQFEREPDALPVEGCFYGMGAATGDVDNDGDVDIYLTNFGPNQLLLNDGKGRFTATTAEWHAGDTHWSVAASLSDFDGDGWLDLYVANYTDFALDNQRPCFNDAAELEYCGPNAYKPVPDRLWRNENGKGFVDVSDDLGIARAYGAGLGVISADFNNDGYTDFFVANDQDLNVLWLSDGNKFINDALLAGVAVNMEGKAEASMGVDATDFDGDGDIDLFMTHLARETNTLYVNDGTGFFEDRTLSLGLGGSSLPYTGFGTGWRDFDNDSDLDLFVANGAVMRIDEQVAAKIPLPLREANQLYENREGSYVDISASESAIGERYDVSRGAIFGDLDNDGDTDIVVTNNNGPVQLLENTLGNTKCWIGARAIDSRYQRDAVGARIRAGDSSWRQVRTDGSYVSASDPRIIFAVDDCSGSVTLEVRWPGGSSETFSGKQPGTYHQLNSGEGDKQ